MDDLIAFLNARLDEDEAAAKAAKAPSPWRAADHESSSWIVTDAADEPLIFNEGTLSLGEAAHIARHDPARVLRGIRARRATLGLFVSAFGGITIAIIAGTRTVNGDWLLRQLAVDYSDHPDYRPEWKP